MEEITVSDEELLGKYTKDNIDDQNGEQILKSGYDIDNESLEKIKSSEVKVLRLANVDTILRGPYIFETIKI